MRKEMLEEIKAQMSMNQQIIIESSTGFQERVNQKKFGDF